MTKLSKMISLALVPALIFAVTACGGRTQKPAGEPAAEEALKEEAGQTEGTAGAEAEEAGTEEAPAKEEEYNIASNLAEIIYEDGTRTIKTDHFTLTLPLGTTWEYAVNDAFSISFYNTAAKNNNCGGHLFTLQALDPADTDYRNIPNYAEAGQADGILYIAVYPSDVQADVTDDRNRADYERVYAELVKIEEQAEDMPLTLK